MAKSSRATIAEETLRAIERGNYTPFNSKPVQLAHKFKFAVDNTQLFKPSDKPTLFKYARNPVTIDTTPYQSFTNSTHVAPQQRNYELEQNYEDYEEHKDTQTETTSQDTNNNNNNIQPVTTTTATTFNIFNNNNNIEKAEKEADKKEEVEEKGKEEKEIKNFKTKIEVKKNTTLGAAKELSDAGHSRLCVLNFASAKNPGGGFLGGAQAQEESLARSSGLYPCLTSPQAKAYYLENAKDKTCVYTHHIIYSPSVPVIKNDDGDYLASPYFPSFITAPAVNWGAAHHRVQGAEVLVRAMWERAAMFLAIAVKNSDETLVLGAWGCGVFAFPPEICANIFHALLIPPTAPFYNMFKHIVFAITDMHLVNLFSQVFSTGPIAVPAGGFPSKGSKHGGGNDKKGGYNKNNNDKKKNGNNNSRKR